MDSLVYRIQVALQLLKRNVESDMLQKTELDITGPQMFMLYYINRHEKCKLTQLADKLEVKPSAITVMIDRLEKPGYVKRVHDTVDRRSILVEMTEAGREVLEKSIRERNVVLNTYVSRLEPEEIVMVTELLEKMAGQKSESIQKKNE